MNGQFKARILSWVKAFTEFSKNPNIKSSNKLQGGRSLIKTKEIFVAFPLERCEPIVNANGELLIAFRLLPEEAPWLIETVQKNAE